MAMAAGGLRGDLADSVVAGFGLAFKADALWVGTGIEGVTINGHGDTGTRICNCLRTEAGKNPAWRVTSRLPIDPRVGWLQPMSSSGLGSVPQFAALVKINGALEGMVRLAFMSQTNICDTC